MGKRKGKTAKDYAREKANKNEPDRVLIVSEGSKTEPDYFRRLIAELGLTTATVRITGEGDSAPISVFEHTDKILANDDDFEQIYLVIDRDTHTSYDEAIGKIKGLAK